MQHVDYSIEYSHIYSNETVGAEHAESIELLIKLRNQLKSEGKTFSLCVMLDNYTFPHRTFDKDIFLSYLSSQGAVPDIFIDEGDLIPAANEVILMLKPKRARELTKYTQNPQLSESSDIISW